MKRNLVLFTILAVLLAAFSLWWFSPTEILKRRLGNLLDSAEVSAAMSDIGRGTRGPRVAGYFADPVRLDPPTSFRHDIGTEIGRERLTSLYWAVAKNCREISFADLEFVEVVPEGESARIHFRVDCLVDLGSRRPADGILDVRSDWIKEDGSWRIKRLRWSESPR